MRRYFRECLLLLFIMLVTAAVYWRVLENDFVAWDDDLEIYLNPHLKGLSAETLKWMFLETGYVVRYQPLAWLTWSVIYELFGREPFGYHLVSLLSHCANTGLVFLLIRKLLLLSQNGQRDYTARHRYLLLCSALGALLWALHPLRVEAVAWASAFLHCQALFFLLIATLCYLEAFSPNVSVKQKRIFYWSSVATFAASLLSYPIGLGFVIVPLVLDMFLLKRFSEDNGTWRGTAARRVWIEKVPFVGVACLVLGITFLLRLNTPIEWARPASLADFSTLHRVMQAFYIWAYYLWKPWLPFDLSPMYNSLVSFDPLSGPFLASMGLVIVLTATLVWKRSQWPAALALWICHLFILVPTLGLTEHPHHPNDRYSLIVAIFWSVLAGSVLYRLSEKRTSRPLAVAVMVAFTGFCGSLSVKQAAIWKNSIVLFEYIIEKLGNSTFRAEIYWRLGRAQLDRSQTRQAIASFEQALEFDPQNIWAHRFLAKIYYDRNRWDEARRHYTAALTVKPNDSELHNGLGAVLAAQGDWAGATEHFSRALQLNPDLLWANYNMGLALANQGKTEEAKVYLEKARRLQKTAPVPTK